MQSLTSKKSIVALVLLSIASMNANAETIVLDLAQAIERAHNTDPRISEKEKLVDVARGMLEEAQGAESWIFDVNSFMGVAPDVRGGVFEDEEGNLKISNDALDIDGLSPWYNLQLSIVYPFSTLGKAESYSEAAQNNIKVQQGEIEIQKANTYIDVVRAYYGYLAAREAIFLIEDANKKVQSAIDLVEVWLEEGKDIKQSDLYALQTGQAILNRHKAEADALQKIAYAGLKLLTGIGKDTSIELADKRLQPVELPSETLLELQGKALSNRPEMKQVEAGLNARRALLSAKNAEKYPNFYTGVVGSFAYTPDRPRLQELAIFDPFNHAGATPVVGVKWDWWAGRQRAQVSQAQGEYDALIEKKSFAQIGIPFDVEEKYHHVQAHHKMVGELTKAARAGRRWMLASFADFEAGVEEASRVMEAFQGYVLAYADYLQVVNDYNLSVARLRVATGEVK